MKNLAFLTSFLISFSLMAQKPSCSVEVSRQTMLMHNKLLVTFTIENTTVKDWKRPVFSHFKVVAGPNTSISTSIINGEVSSRASYSYYVTPNEPGTWTIPAVSIETSEGIFSTQPLEILVKPNPDGIVEELPEKDDFFYFFNQSPSFGSPNVEPPNTKKSKRKTYKL